jgi:hypothetical protein
VLLLAQETGHRWRSPCFDVSNLQMSSTKWDRQTQVYKLLAGA